MNQQSLFPNELGPWHHSAPDTSRQAAIQNYPRSGTQRARVLLAIAQSPDGLTDHEACELLRLSPSSERPRRGELVAAGLVEDSGAQRPTDTGAMAVVWQATSSGIAVVAASLLASSSAIHKDA